jgi:glutaredoxin 3
MKDVVLYTTATCPYCIRAKRLLTNKGVVFTDVNVNEAQDKFEAIKQQTGWNTVPQIFIDGVFVGGCDDIIQLERQGKLDELLR